MATSDEIQKIAAFLAKITYIYAEAEKLEGLSNWINSRYASILANTDNWISSAAWAEVISETNRYIASGNIAGLDSLRETISGWSDSSPISEMA